MFLLFQLCALVKSLIRNYINRERRTETRLKEFNEDYACENKHFQLSMQIIGNSAIELQNSTSDQFGPDENVPISNEETVGSVHSQ
uniref:Uncharacterized protein n=1 Tax=Caenorhabditis japonica TaxID=281687 RepID=A0A8R1IPM6_CAEJA